MGFKNGIPQHQGGSCQLPFLATPVSGFTDLSSRKEMEEQRRDFKSVSRTNCLVVILRKKYISNPIGNLKFCCLNMLIR